MPGTEPNHSMTEVRNVSGTQAATATGANGAAAATPERSIASGTMGTTTKLATGLTSETEPKWNPTSGQVAIAAAIDAMRIVPTTWIGCRRPATSASASSG